MDGNLAVAATQQNGVLALLGSVPEWIVAVTAVAGLVVAWRQFGKIVDANKNQVDVAKNQVDIARAELMLKIDTQFESAEMRESRIVFRTLRNHCEREIKKSNSSLSDDIAFSMGTKLFSQNVTELYSKFKSADRLVEGVILAAQPNDEAGEQYFRYMRFPNWIETVGLLTRHGLLPKHDVLQLYDEVVIRVMSHFDEHVRMRRDEGPMRNQRFLENAYWLKDEAENLKAQRAGAAANFGRARPGRTFG